MKKIIVAIVLIIIVAVVGAPFFSGIIMQRVVKQAFEDINQTYAATGSLVSVEISRYDRGFSSSRIEWKLNLGNLKAFYKVDEIIFVDTANHGFLSIVSETSLEKNKWFTDFVENKLDGKNPLAIQTEYNFSGDIKSKLLLDAFSFKEGGDEIRIMPGKLLVSLDKGFKNIVSEMNWKGCVVPGKFKMSNLLATSKMKKMTPLLWDGDASFGIKNIQVDNNNKTTELSNFKCDYNLDYNQEKSSISFGMGYGMDHFSSAQNDIKNASVRININNIDAREFEDFAKIYSQKMAEMMDEINQSKQSPEVIPKAFEKQMAAVGLQLAGAYEKLLKKDLEIQVTDLRAQLPQGDIKADVTLRLKKDMTFAQFIPIMMQPSAAMGIFDLHSRVSLPWKLVKENQALLSPVYPGMQTGLFIKDGDVLDHTATTREGKLFLNSHEVILN